VNSTIFAIVLSHSRDHVNHFSTVLNHFVKLLNHSRDPVSHFATMLNHFANLLNHSQDFVSHSLEWLTQARGVECGSWLIQGGTREGGGSRLS
jgi:hypothetical protein